MLATPYTSYGKLWRACPPKRLQNVVHVTRRKDWPRQGCVPVLCLCLSFCLAFVLLCALISVKLFVLFVCLFFLFVFCFSGGYVLFF